jgi:hypothetical protein
MFEFWAKNKVTLYTKCEDIYQTETKTTTTMWLVSCDPTQKNVIENIKNKTIENC